MRWHQHQYDLETPQAKSIMIRLVWFGRNSRLTISVNDLSWPLIHRIIQPPEGQLESWMIDLFLGCTSPLPDSKGCFSAKSKTCKTCNKLGKEAASLSLLCQRQPSTKPVAHLFKLVILTITINWSNLVSPLSTIIPIPMTIKSEHYYHITIKSITTIISNSQTIISNQNTTITSLSNLVAHLVKLIPGGREERLFGLLAEWHKAWKWLV